MVTLCSGVGVVCVGVGGWESEVGVVMVGGPCVVGWVCVVMYH